MKALGKIGLCFSLVASSLLAAPGDDPPVYLWPTDASKHLTSAFCEYRARRYHAGIDIKTWGKVGYNVFAVRPGYVWRISVSPFGYGKALYLKLDTGEIAVYAHLSAFSKKIAAIVEKEQKRLGRYRVNLFLKPGVLPVTQGEVVGYTGQTGIGAPHLHFEIRTARNEPINPLSKGYRLPDRVSPIVRKISLSPLDAESEVEHDFRPLILAPSWVRAGTYRIDRPVQIWGNVGLAISCYDKGSNSANGFGVYSLKLFVDDVLRFSYRYDRLSFLENPMVELERDYRLSRRHFGRFQKLYKDRFNARNIYQPDRTWAGVMRSASLDAQPTIRSRDGREGPRAQEAFQFGSLFPGPHDFRIEVADYFGNVSEVTGTVYVGGAFDIQPLVTENENGQLVLQNVLTYDLKDVQQVDAFYLSRARWRQVEVQPLLVEPRFLEEKGGEAESDEPVESTAGFLLRSPPAGARIFKFVARDQFNARSYPSFYVRMKDVENPVQPQLEVHYDFYDDYLRLEMTSKTLLLDVPKVVLYPDRPDFQIVEMHRLALKKYVGRVPLSQLSGDEHLLKIAMRNLNGEEFVDFALFRRTRVPAHQDARVFAPDGNLWLKFWPGSLYRPLYCAITIDSTESPPRQVRVVSNIYKVEPRDVLLRQGALVNLVYP
ncbi:MAG: M23 family metallopeptidase, partial [Calditrichaeota bacterium]